MPALTPAPAESPLSKSASLSSRHSKVPFAGGLYVLSHRLGNGSFGDIFEGYDTVKKMRVAVKLEKKKARYPQLEYESKVYRVLHQPPAVAIPENSSITNTSVGSASSNAMAAAAAAVTEHNQQQQQLQGKRRSALRPFVVGIPNVFYYDTEGDYNIMVMELCGPSLEDLFNYCHRRFSMKTVLMIAEQMLYRMQYVHERGFVHRDIKPENFTLGAGRKSHFLYVIDFGLSKLYWDCRRNVHIPFVEGKPLTGTARYCSVNTHKGYEQSRRDDLESVGFLLVYFLKGSLPWQGIQAKDQELKTIKIGEKKINTTLDELYKGLPSEFLVYAQYCRQLSFQQKPDYEYLRGLFRGLAQRMGYLCPARRTADGAYGNGNNQNGSCNGNCAVDASSSSQGKDCCSAISHGVTHSSPDTKLSFHNNNNNVNNNNNNHNNYYAHSSDDGSAPPPIVGISGVNNNSSKYIHNNIAATPPPSDLMGINSNNASSHQKGGEMSSNNNNSSRAASFGVVEDPDPSRGFYDWMFDWLKKREGEVTSAGQPDAPLSAATAMRGDAASGSMVL